MNRFRVATLAAVFIGRCPVGGTTSVNKQQVWSLEDAYWRYVQAHDLQTLSHPLGS